MRYEKQLQDDIAHVKTQVEEERRKVAKLETEMAKHSEVRVFGVSLSLSLSLSLSTYLPTSISTFFSDLVLLASVF